MIADALATRGIQELDVVGFSSGAYRAVSLALSGRVRVSRLVLTSGAVVFDPSDRARFAGIAGQLRAGANLRPLMPRVMLSPGYAAAHPEAVSEVEGWLDIVSTEDLANEFEAFSRCPAVMPGFAALAIPMTLRFGELDEGVSSAHVAEMQRSNARLVVERVAGVGHSLLIEDTTATVASIVRALAADLRP